MSVVDGPGLGCVVLIAGAVFWLARSYEFATAFRKRVYNLHPDDISRDPYVEPLRGILRYGEVARARRHFAWGSTVLVVLLAFFVGHSPAVGHAFSQIVPPAVYSILAEGLRLGPGVSAAYHAFFFAVLLHSFPFLVLLTREMGASAAQEKSRWRGVLSDLGKALFVFQQFILDRMIDSLLRDTQKGIGRRDSSKNYDGSVTEMVKSEIAEAMLKAEDSAVQAAIKRHFPDAAGLPRPADAGEHSQIEGPEPAPIGHAGAAVGNLQFETTPKHEWIMGLIDRYGIPYVRRLLHWQSSERGKRYPTTLDTAGTIEGFEFAQAWVRNVGETLDGKRLNSLLIGIPNPLRELKEAAQPDATLILTNLGSEPVKPGLFCRIVRANTPKDSQKLFVGSVVQDTDTRRFDKYIRARGTLN